MMLDMTVEAIINEIKKLPPDEVQKFAQAMNEDEFFDGFEAERRYKKHLASGEQGTPAEEVFNLIKD